MNEMSLKCFRKAVTESARCDVCVCVCWKATPKDLCNIVTTEMIDKEISCLLQFCHDLKKTDVNATIVTV